MHPSTPILAAATASGATFVPELRSRDTLPPHRPANNEIDQTNLDRYNPRVINRLAAHFFALISRRRCISPRIFRLHPHDSANSQTFLLRRYSVPRANAAALKNATFTAPSQATKTREKRRRGTIPPQHPSIPRSGPLLGPQRVALRPHSISGNDLSMRRQILNLSVPATGVKIGKTGSGKV